MDNLISKDYFILLVPNIFHYDCLSKNNSILVTQMLNLNHLGFQLVQIIEVVLYDDFHQHNLKQPISQIRLLIINKITLNYF